VFVHGSGTILMQCTPAREPSGTWTGTQTLLGDAKNDAKNNGNGAGK
jgi:hypothetical protein